MKKTATHLFFYTKNEHYSNWYPSPFTHDGILFQNSEQGMMYEKAKLMGDMGVIPQILATSNPREAKVLGRKIKPWNEELWVTNRIKLVTKVLIAKYSQHPELEAELVASYPLKLVEASGFDSIWGVGMWETDVRILNEENWQGLNLLGEALMNARDHFIQLNQSS